MTRLALLCFVAACSGASTPTPTPAPGAVEYGSKCSPEGTCPATLECVKYYGIAGPKGPQFSSCEMRCDGKEGCPTGLDCITIADGPGQVCRKK
jgi:hypothetical protein